ncbi:MAG TPA: tetratricopeptide repeat protein, partial [Polyangia bacterium]
FLRLQELEKDGQVKSEGEAKQVGAGGAHALGPEINASFLKAAEHYVAACRVSKFEKIDVALLELGVLLEANGMEARAKAVLERLLKNYPDSKAAKEVLSGDVTKTEGGE